ncbi:MAG: SRPBCC family protein [Paludibacter sp.]
MKTTKTLGIVLLILVLSPLFVALFVSRVVVYEKTININAPINMVWDKVNSLSDLNRWSPWAIQDPNIKIVISGGKDSIIGATQTWKSKIVEIGKGSQTITKMEKPFLLESSLKFTQPYKSESNSYILLVSNENGTKLTWGIQSRMPYPSNIKNLFVDLDVTMNRDLDIGLAKLKEICENQK